MSKKIVFINEIIYIHYNFFVKVLDIMSILHKSPNSIEINIVRYPPKIFNFNIFNIVIF